MKRKYPLFIIDSSRAHGRGKETDYISCTSKELPFVAEVTYITEDQFLKEYNRDNKLVAYDTGRNGFRLRLEVVEVAEDYEPSQLRSLLLRAIKEFIKRSQLTEITDNISSPKTKLVFVNELIKQGLQQRRLEPENKVIEQSLEILNSIKKDYELLNSNNSSLKISPA